MRALLSRDMFPGDLGGKCGDTFTFVLPAAAKPGCLNSLCDPEPWPREKGLPSHVTLRYQIPSKPPIKITARWTVGHYLLIDTTATTSPRLVVTT